jgi:hypothetical protein
MSSNTIQKNIYYYEHIEEESFCFKARSNKKQFLKKTISKDRHVRNQLKLILINYDRSNIQNKLGVCSKRSLKINTKKINKTPFKTTNLGKKRMNTQSIYHRYLNYEDDMLQQYI